MASQCNESHSHIEQATKRPGSLQIVHVVETADAFIG